MLLWFIFILQNINKIFTYDTKDRSKLQSHSIFA